MKKNIVIAALILVLGGCATTKYKTKVTVTKIGENVVWGLEVEEK